MTLDKTTLRETAIRLLSDYDNVTPGRDFARGLKLDLSDAWQLQTAVTRLREARGEKVIGYKVGAVDPGNQEMLGVSQPVWGRLWDTEQHKRDALLRKTNYANLSVEAEFGISLSRGVTPDMSMDEIAASVEAVYIVLELHNLIFRGDSPHGLELIANNAINCGIVCGEPIKQLPESCHTDLKLVFDGQTIDEWSSLQWPADILRAIGWLAQSLSDTGLVLNSGDFLLCSAWGPPIPVGDYTQIEATSSAFGSVKCRVI